MNLEKKLSLSKKEVKVIEEKINNINLKNAVNETEKYITALKKKEFTKKEKNYIRIKIIDNLEMNSTFDFILFFLESKLLLTLNLKPKLKEELIKVKNRNEEKYLKEKPIISRIIGYTFGIFIGFNLITKKSSLYKIK